MALAMLNRLDLLAKLYGEVRIPEAVYREVVTQGLAQGAADARTVQLFCQRHDWPIMQVSEKLLAGLRPSSVLDAGEMEVPRPRGGRSRCVGPDRRRAC